MSEIKGDELGWKLGPRHPELYARCMLAWAGLGDLVHDSPDPVLHESNPGSPLPTVDKFLVFGDSFVDCEPVTAKKVGTYSLQLTLASWNHITVVSDVTTRRAVPERRFAVGLIETTEERGKRQQYETELLVGQGCTVTTTGKKAGAIQAMRQTYGYNVTVVKGLCNFLERAPDGKIAAQTADRKKKTRTELYDRARGLHGIDLSGSEVDILGNMIVDGTTVRELTERVRQDAVAVNGIRMPIVSTGISGNARLFDKFRYLSRRTTK